MGICILCAVNDDPRNASAACSPDTTGQEHAQQLLEIAEYVAQCIDGTRGDPAKFPTRERFIRELHTRPERVNAAFDLLRWRGLLAEQRDPLSGGTRLLPDASATGRRKARDTIADRIAFRIKLGIWNGDTFPTVEGMRDQFRCGLHTLCDALQILKEQRLVHKALVVVEGPHRSRDYLWRPIEVVGEAPGVFTSQLKDAILAGELTGALPFKAEMAARYGVSQPTAAAAYTELQREGLIAKAWKQGDRLHTWYVALGEPPEGLLPGDTKSLAVARDIIDRTPFWLSQLPDGTWARRWVPVNEALKRHYGTDVFVIEQAVELLVCLQIIERAPLPQRRYVPRPPADRGHAYGLAFRSHKRRKRRWERAGDPVEWLPFPTSGQDPIVHELRSRLSRQARRREPAKHDGDSAYARADASSNMSGDKGVPNGPDLRSARADTGVITPTRRGASPDRG